MSMLLDSTVYPHIVDLIVDSADNETQHALRATCRALKARMDAALFAHVELTYSDDPDLCDVVALRSPYGRLPGPAFPPSFMRFQAEPGIWPSRLKHTRILDVNMNTEREWIKPWDLPALWDALKDVKTVRRWVHEEWKMQLRPERVVDCLTLTRKTDWENEWGKDESGSGHKPKKHVVHIRYDPLYEKLQEVEILFKGIADHMVFMFSPVDEVLPR
jgi:hypothetical protein